MIKTNMNFASQNNAEIWVAKEIPMNKEVYIVYPISGEQYQDYIEYVDNNENYIELWFSVCGIPAIALVKV